jgi:tetratricopeptide (TPR) repeat protein
LTDHPRAETLASFLEGTLPPPELARVAKHLRECPECRRVVSESARFEREEGEVARAEGAEGAERIGLERVGAETTARESAQSETGGFEHAESAAFERIDAKSAQFEGAASEPAQFERVELESARFERVEAESIPFERAKSESVGVQRVQHASAPRTRTVRWWWAAAAAIVALVTTSLLLRRDGDPRAQLIAAAPRDHRFVEARLFGFPWARLQLPTRGLASADADPAELKLRGAAGNVLASTAPQHARGVALLLIGHGAEAVVELEAATVAHPKDAAVWNDLAAARDASALSTGRRSLFASALAAANRALALDPQSPAALFNRALILEHLGRQADARAAYERYLAADGASSWAAEARERLAKLAAGP